MGGLLGGGGGQSVCSPPPLKLLGGGGWPPAPPLPTPMTWGMRTESGMRFIPYYQVYRKVSEPDFSGPSV